MMKKYFTLFWYKGIYNLSQLNNINSGSLFIILILIFVSQYFILRDLKKSILFSHFWVKSDFFGWKERQKENVDICKTEQSN